MTVLVAKGGYYGFANSRAARVALRQFFERYIAAIDAGLIEDAIDVGVIALLLEERVRDLAAHAEDAADAFNESAAGNWQPGPAFRAFMDCPEPERQRSRLDEILEKAKGPDLPGSIPATDVQPGSKFVRYQGGREAIAIGRDGSTLLGVESDGAFVSVCERSRVVVTEEPSAERSEAASDLAILQADLREAAKELW